MRQKQSRFAYYIGKLILKAYDLGFELTFGDAWALPCPRCGWYGHSDVSKHKERLAFDLNLFKNGKYLTTTEAHRPLGEYWESLDVHCSWGGRFDDGNHYSWGENDARDRQSHTHDPIKPRKAPNRRTARRHRR